MPETTEPQLAEAQVDAIERGARLDQCRIVVSTAVPNCLCRRPAGHIGAHSESIPATDVFWIHPAIPALIRDWRALREYAEFCDNRHVGMAEDLGICRNKIDALREQLADITSERDRWEKRARELGHLDNYNDGTI